MGSQKGDFIEGIAVIGMSIRFPGAPTIAQYWDNLRNGVESISEFSHDELLASGVPEAMINQPGFVPAGAVLDDIDLFDGKGQRGPVAGALHIGNDFGKALTDPHQCLCQVKQLQCQCI